MASITSPSQAKSITTKDGTTYGLVHVPAKESSNKKPTLLFIHGYPSSSYDWRFQIETFSAAGYEIIAPDLLGYGDTDKPTSVKDYSLVRMGGHVEEICDQLNAKNGVVAIAHDWGSGLLSSMIKQSQKRYIGFVFASIGYVPNLTMDVDTVNTQTQAALGRPLFGYWKFHEQDDAAEVIGNNAEAYLSLVYPEKPELWITDLCPIGKARAWTESGEVRPRPSWLSEKEHNTHTQIMQKGGWAGPLNWYKQSIAGISSDDEQGLTEESKIITKPVFFMGASKDFVGLEDMHRSNTQEWAKNGFETVSVEAGHWLFLEKRKEFDDALAGWLDKTFPSGTKI